MKRERQTQRLSLFCYYNLIADAFIFQLNKLLALVFLL